MCENINNYISNDNKFNKEEELIFNLLFGEINILNIELDKFCTYKKRTIFKDKIRKIAKKGKVKITDDRILHKYDTLIWKIEIKK